MNGQTIPFAEMQRYQIATCLLLQLGILLASGCANRSQLLPVHALRPLSYLESHMSATPSWWEGFRRATDQEQAFQLVQLEPYRTDKIPVVLIHGLLSSPETWRELLASCYADETIRNNYQFWVFHYPTGITYLESAKQLRRRVLNVRATYDPSRTNYAFSNMVLVGHSMGGLIAKLQVTSSENLIWQAIAKGPFDQLVCEDKTRNEIRELLFFEPVPGVRRAIYIATPHHGARIAANPLIRLGKGLVAFPKETRTRFSSLAKSNGSLFNRSFLESTPTSIDHLSPSSPVMLATKRLPMARGVLQHSIIGSDGPPGDNVVDFRSSHWPSAISEEVVDASHTEITKSTETIAEVQRILFENLQQMETNEYTSEPSFRTIESNTTSDESPRE
jgi:triacylglycerol esterase/lipase EstA (alpha/beta hydrolase family)